MGILSDNPIFRQMMRLRRRSPAAALPIMVPIVGVGILLVAATLWYGGVLPANASLAENGMPFRDASGPLDIALPLLAVLFWFHCVVGPFMVLRDPLGQAVRENVADQLVLTGVTPAVWLRGHILALLVELFITLCVYAPFFAACLCFGRSDAVTVLRLIWAGIALGVTARLVWLFALRLHASGLVAALVLCGGLVLAMAGGSSTWLPLAALSPLPLVGDLAPPAFLGIFSPHGSGLPRNLVRVLYHLGSWRDAGTSIVVFTKAHVVGWCLLVPGILLGGVRAHRELVPPLTGAQVGPLRLGGAPVQAAKRRLGLLEALGLFFDNSALRYPALWEMLHLAAATIVTSTLGVCWVVTVARLAEEGDMPVLLAGAAGFMALAVAAGSCFDRSVLRTSHTVRILTPVVLVTLLRGALLLGMMDVMRVTLAPIRDLVVSPVAATLCMMLALLAVAAWQSLVRASRTGAQLAVVGGALVWLGVTVAVQRWSGLAPALVPVPATLVLILAAAAGMLLACRRRHASINHTQP